MATTSLAPHLRMAALAAALGLVAGGAAWVLLHLIALVTNVMLFHRWGWTMPDFADLRPSIWIIVAAVAGSAVVTLLALWAPVIRGHGIPEAMDAVLTRQSRIAPRTAVAKPLSSAIAIGSGGPFGAEGPIIVTGGALGSLLGQVLHTSANERKILLASGAAAGMAATFGTPIAAVVLAIELLLFEFSSRALVPLVVATSVAAAVHAALYGPGPLFSVPAHGFAGLSQLPWFALLGIACGLLATLIARGLFVVERAYRRLPIAATWHPILGALVWAPIGLLAPRVLGVGYDVIDDALAGRLAAATLAALAIGKLVVWWIALASGTSGGTLAPILLISSCAGALAGQGLHELVPSVSPNAFAVVAMAATFGAATRAPFAAIVFVFELTRDYDAILPLMGATVLAELVARALLDESLMTEKLARREVRVPGTYAADVLTTTSVGDIMSREVESMVAALPIEAARQRFVGGRHHAYPVVDGTGRYVGMATADHVLDASTGTIGDVVEPSDVMVSPDDDALTALASMVDGRVDHLPVLAGDRLVGICTRTDLLRARHAALGADQREAGWIGRFRPRPT